jgi:glutathione S-transferase
MGRTLFGLRVSPWTERARWALDHHRVAYAYHEHMPMLGEMLLRRKAGTKKASVPLLDDSGDVVMGSLEIARHAEKTKGGSTLFPDGKDAEIEHWADVAERLTNAGRHRFIAHVIQNRAVQAESLPSFVPGALRGVFAPSAGMAVRFLSSKYGVSHDTAAVDAEYERTVRAALEETREAIKVGGYVLAKDCFTFADIALASSLQVVKPRQESQLGPATREAWTHAKLADEFDDLLAWRDTVYAKHRSS